MSPLVSAVIGRRVSNPTVWHTRLQSAAVLIPLVILFTLVAKAWFSAFIQYRTIDIAAGEEGLSYYQIATDLQNPIQKLTGRDVAVHSLTGSDECQENLLKGVADLAVLQENVIEVDSRTRILAPIYYETILVLVRGNSGISKIAELRGRAIALGRSGSGMRRSAETVLEGHGLRSQDLLDIDHSWKDLLTNGELEGAIVTIKIDNQPLRKLMASGDYRLLPIYAERVLVPLQTTTIRKADLPRQLELPDQGLPTAQTIAVLAVREDAPSWFVEDCLQALYEKSEIISGDKHLFSREQAADLGGHLNLHPAASRYLDTSSRK